MFFTNSGDFEIKKNDNARFLTECYTIYAYKLKTSKYTIWSGQDTISYYQRINFSFCSVFAAFWRRQQAEQTLIIDMVGLWNYESFWCPSTKTCTECSLDGLEIMQLKLKDVNLLFKNVSFDFRKIFYKYLHSWFVLNFDFTNFFFFCTWLNFIKKLIKASYIYHRKSIFDTFSQIFSNLYISGTNFNSSAKISLLC